MPENKVPDDILFLNKFSRIPNLIHGFSTREFGSMKLDNPSHSSLSRFSRSLGIDSSRVVRMRQVHEDRISWVDGDLAGSIIESTDGLLSDSENIFLSVLTADCVPVLFFDQKSKFFGVAHAGWKGLEKEILKKTIDKLVSAGSSTHDIIVGIGPCIRSCCYNINENRALVFKNKYPGVVNLFEIRNGKLYLDLAGVARYSLKLSGIPDVNIDDCGICTSHENNRFYSYRKEKEKYGVFMGLIGLKK